MAPTKRGHGNGRVMNGWTSEEPGTTTRIDLPTTFFDGHVSECSKVECVCVFLRVFFIRTSAMVSRISSIKTARL